MPVAMLRLAMCESASNEPVGGQSVIRTMRVPHEQREISLVFHYEYIRERLTRALLSNA